MSTTKELTITLIVRLTEEVDVDGFVVRSVLEDIRDGKVNDYVDEVELCEWDVK